MFGLGDLLVILSSSFVMYKLEATKRNRHLLIHL